MHIHCYRTTRDFLGSPHDPVGAHREHESWRQPSLAASEPGFPAGRQDAALTGRREARLHKPPRSKSRVRGLPILLIALTSFQAMPAEDRLPALNPATASLTNPPLRQVGPGVFELGKVRLDKARRTVSFPAVLNMNAGLIEYLVVTESGKTHESLVRTDVAPYQIHLAMLLLGAQGAGTNAFPENHTNPLPGDPVRIELVWKVKGKEQRLAAEATLRKRATHAEVSPGVWIYTGSRVIEGTFLAQEIGSIVSLIEDPDALINNPRPGRENDELWEIKPRGLPALDSSLQVILKLESRPSSP